jgi:glycosyltransferase involved in cell wall biosynthesis
MFSVIIPLYNKAPHIAAALQSVLAQTFPPDEIIVVDDGSTDGGAEIAAAFSARGVTLIRQSNAGVSAARNRGAKAARSAYLTFLDADDIWLPNHLETLRSVIVQVPSAGLVSTLYKIQQGKQMFHPHSAFADGFTGRVDDFCRRMASGLSLVHSSTAGVARPAFFEAGGFPHGMRRGEDLVLWLKLARGFEVGHAASVTAIHNRDAVNRSVSLRESQAPGSLLYLQEMMGGPGLSASEQASAKLLFARIAFYTAAGMREAGDLSGLAAIRRLAAEMKMPELALRIRLLGALPPFALSFARRFRHRDRQTIPA